MFIPTIVLLAINLGTDYYFLRDDSYREQPETLFDWLIDKFTRISISAYFVCLAIVAIVFVPQYSDVVWTVKFLFGISIVFQAMDIIYQVWLLIKNEFKFINFFLLGLALIGIVYTIYEATQRLS